MHHEFAYQCPHCEETIRVADDVMGEVVDCPVCGSPFKVDVPTARAGDPHRVTRDTPAIDRPDREEGELVRTHPAMFRAHPVRFGLFLLMVLAGGAALILALFDHTVVGRLIQLSIGGLVVLIGGFFLIKWWLEVRYTTLIVTTKRTILRKGIISRSTSEVQHEDVRNIQVDQNMYERVVGVGDLAVSSAGQDDLEIDIDGVPDPEQLAETIRDLQ